MDDAQEVIIFGGLLFPMKSNEPTVKIMMKNGGQIIGDFKNQKHIIRIPLE